MDNVFSSLKINSKYTLKNRLVVAPMTTSQSNADGSLSQAESEWLERLARDGYGLLITCAAAISSTSVAFPRQLSVGDKKLFPALRDLATRLNKYGGLPIVQLCHGGSRATPELTGASVSYSASSYDLAIPGFIKPKELSREQIQQIIDDFANACVLVAEAGFAGVEFHGANGYLFTQFISQMTNFRQDEYGGSLENRARFTREVVRACRLKVPAEFILGFRILFEGSFMDTGLDIDENIQIVNWLKEDGIDYIHTSQMDYAAKSEKYPEKIILQYVRQEVNHELPLIGVGGVVSLSDAKKAMEYGADLVAIGRAAIGNADLPKVFARGEELVNKLPFNESLLRDLQLSNDFIQFIKAFPQLLNLYHED